MILLHEFKVTMALAGLVVPFQCEDSANSWQM